MMADHHNARPSGDAIENLLALLLEAQSIADGLSVPEVGARLQDVINLLGSSIED